MYPLRDSGEELKNLHIQSEAKKAGVFAWDCKNMCVCTRACVCACAHTYGCPCTHAHFKAEPDGLFLALVKEPKLQEGLKIK